MIVVATSIDGEVAEDTHGFATEAEAKAFACGFRCGALAPRPGREFGHVSQAETYWWGSDSLAHLIVLNEYDDSYGPELVVVLKRLDAVERVDALLEKLHPGGYDANGVPQLTPEQLTEFARLVTETPWTVERVDVVDLGVDAGRRLFGPFKAFDGASIVESVRSASGYRSCGLCPEGEMHSCGLQKSDNGK